MMITQALKRRIPPASFRFIPYLKQILAQWRQRHCTRRHLQSLSDYELRDIGLDRRTAFGESSRPFWRN